MKEKTHNQKQIEVFKHLLQVAEDSALDSVAREDYETNVFYFGYITAMKEVIKILTHAKENKTKPLK